MHKLKPLQIKNAKPGKFSDGGGLYFVKTAISAKWIYRFTIGGKRREMGLGSFPSVSLADARLERDKWAKEVRANRDPIIERENQRQTAIDELNKTDPTFSELAEMVFEAKKPSLRGDGKRGRWFSPIKVHLIPKIGKKRVSQITQIDIDNALRPIWKTKAATAEKASQRLRIIFQQGKLMGLETDPFTVDAAVHGLGDLKRTVKHIRATDWRDIPALYEKLNKPLATHRALRLIILTAVRATPARTATKSEFAGDIWTVPADKMKGKEGKVKDFRIPLSQQAQDEIAIWISEAEQDCLFSSRRGKPISDRSIELALDDIGEAGRPHGLRSSFRTWVQDTEAGSYDVAETQLAHIIGNKVERSYARSDLLDQRRILMQRWADYVTRAETKVIKLRR